MTAPAPAVPSAAALVLAASSDLPPTLTGAARRDTAIRTALARALDAGDRNAVLALAAGYDGLLLTVPSDGALRAVGNAERRHRGAFSTPPAWAAALARRALPSPPAECGTPGGGNAVVDPACGAGALLRAAFARLVELGATPDAALADLHGVDADPLAVELCRAALAAQASALLGCDPGELLQALAARIVVGDALLGGTPSRPAADAGAVTWHRRFPAVLDVPGGAVEPVTGWRGGFDAVLANPPWERLKVHARDWGGAPPDGLRGDRAAGAKALRAAGRHPLTGLGELNAYLPFTETCWRLLAPAGRAAVLVPAGIVSDRSSSTLMAALIGAGALERLDLIDPPAPIFAGVSARIGVAVLTLSGGPSAPARRRPARVTVGLTGPHQHDDETDRSWPLDVELLRTVNPNTGTAPLFGSAQDARIVTAVHRRTPVLQGRANGVPTDDPWELRLLTPLHMTRDARHFRTAPGPGLLPLYEAKHCGLLDPLGGGAAHRYWVPEELVHERLGPPAARGWLAGYRNVSTAVAPRTLLPTPLPVAGVGNSLPLISAPHLPLLLAALASLPVDYLLRQKHAGANVNFFKLEQVPVPPPSAYAAPAPWTGGRPLREWVLERFARAVVWRPGLSVLAGEVGGVPEVTDADRAVARAELDAAHAVLLGFDRADLEHALGTFTALRRREEGAAGRFVTGARILAAWDDLGG